MKLPYKVMSTAALAAAMSIIPSAITHAAAGDFYDANTLKHYTKSDLVAKPDLVNQLSDALKNGDVILKELNKGIFIDYAKTQSAFEEAFAAKPDDVVAAIITAKTQGTVTAPDVTKYTDANTTTGVTVSSVSAITGTTVTVTLPTGFNVTAAADVNNYSISINGAAAVKPTAVTVTGSSAKLSVALDGQEGTLTVNGVAGNATAGTDKFDFKKPTIASVSALDAKHIQITLSEKVATAGAEIIANYSLYDYATGSLVNLDTLAGGGKATAKLQADGKTVVITFSGTITDGKGFVVNGLTNGKYLLYVNQSDSTNKVQDLAGNAMITNSNFEFTGTTAASEGNIQLISATYSKAAKTLSITGSELINNNSGKIDVTKLALTDGTTTVALKNATYTTGTTGTTSVTLDLSTMATADLDKISALAGNVSVVASDAAYEDMNGNAAKGNTVVATQTVLPVVTTAEYNEATNVLKLTFDTQIDISKVITFADLKVNTVDVSAGATLKTTSNSNIVEIQLSDATAATMEAYSTGVTALRTNTVVEAPVAIPAGMFTKVGATTADPGQNLATTIAKATVVQDTVAPTVTANIKGLDGSGAGMLTLTGSQELDTAITGASIKFYASDDMKNAIGSLDPVDVLSRVSTTKAYELNLVTKDGDLADAIKTKIDAGKTIVMTIGKGAIKNINLTDINAVDTTAPITVSVAEANYGSAVKTVASSSATSNLVDVTFKDAQGTPKDVQLDKAIAEGTAAYQFVSIANSNIKVDATAKYVWNTTTSTGVLHVVPNSTLIAGDYKLVLTGLKTNTGLAVEDATTPGIATIASVTITTDGTAPTLASTDITLKDSDNSGTLSAGDTLTVKFSEPMKLDTAAAADVFTPSAHSLGSSTVALGSDPSVVIVTLASDSTLALADTLTANVNTHITDLAGNKVAASQTTAGVAKPSGITNPAVKSEVYVDANNNGVVDKGDTLTIKFDQTVKAAEGSDLTDDVTLAGAAFVNPVLSGDTLTLTIDTPPTSLAIVGQTATISGTTNITNSWGDKAGTAGVAITSADTTSPKVVGVTYGTEDTDKYLYITMSEAVNLGTSATFADAFTVDSATGTVTGTDVLSLDPNDTTNKTVRVKLVAGDNIITGLTNINVALTADKVLDASGNKVQKSNTTGYTVAQK